MKKKYFYIILLLIIIFNNTTAFGLIFGIEEIVILWWLGYSIVFPIRLSIYTRRHSKNRRNYKKNLSEIIVAYLLSAIFSCINIIDFSDFSFSADRASVYIITSIIVVSILFSLSIFFFYYVFKS